MQAVLWQLTQNILFHPSAEKLVLTHIYSQDWKLYHNIKMISHWSLVICPLPMTTNNPHLSLQAEEK